jgi:hypothetical protein
MSAALPELQTLVDDLADELQRSVVVNDPVVRMLCTSRHFGDEDEVRVRAVLQRDAGPEVSRYVLDQGVARWTRAGPVPAEPGLGLRARWCVPLRGRDGLLGLLMVIDDGSLTPGERARIDAVAADAAALLDVAADAEGRRRRDDEVRRLLDADAGTRQDAVRAVADRIADGEVAVTVLDVRGTAVPETRRVLRAVLDSAARPAPRRCLTAVDDRQGVLVHSAPRLDPDHVRAAAERMVAAVVPLSGSGLTAVAGTGSVESGLDGAWRSADRARTAARGARLVPGLGPVTGWGDLGAWSVLLRLPDSALGPDLVPDPVRRLLDDPRAERHVTTARAYLDHAGSIPRTAAALHLHRTSLYYRLEQLARISGLDLDDGRDRLLLHVGLLAAELTHDT